MDVLPLLMGQGDLPFEMLVPSYTLLIAFFSSTFFRLFSNVRF